MNQVDEERLWLPDPADMRAKTLDDIASSYQRAGLNDIRRALVTALPTI